MLFVWRHTTVGKKFEGAGVPHPMLSSVDRYPWWRGLYDWWNCNVKKPSWSSSVKISQSFGYFFCSEIAGNLHSLCPMNFNTYIHIYIYIHTYRWHVIPFGHVIEYRSVTSSLCKRFYSNLKTSSWERNSCCKNVCFQIASTTECEDREVWSFTKSHTNLSYLSLDPNHRIQH